MYEVGDYIIYGNNGVCVVDDVGPIDSPGVSRDRIYYTLSPYYKKGSTIFIPVDNQKVIMRSVITKEVALGLIEDIQNIEELWIPDEKRREVEYKEALRTCDCRELVRIIKTIYQHKQLRIDEGKKVSVSDEKYFQMAEDNLYGEIAISLSIDVEKVRDFILKGVEESA